MTAVRFIHTADWQIGMPSDFLTERASTLIEEARFEAIEAMRDFVNNRENGIDFVVVCGDIFDDSRIGHDLIDRTLGIISLFECPVYAIAGNHEVKGGEDIFKSDFVIQNQPSNLFILDAPFIDLKTGVEIISAPTTATHQNSNTLATRLRELEPSNRIRIALGHGRVDTISYAEDSESIIKEAEIEELIESKKIDYVALGDRHSFTKIGSTGKFFYSGSPEATDFNEIATGRYVIVSIASKGETSATDQIVGKWKLIRIGKPNDRFIIRSQANVNNLRDELESLDNKAKTAVKIYLDIDTDPDTFNSLEEMMDRAKKQFATVVLRDGNERNVAPIISGNPAEEEIPDYLTGYMRDAYSSLHELASGSGPKQLTALTALRNFKRIMERSK